MTTKTDMGYNIENYLKWRGDIPFSADPFNEVDNLVLCELSYADLDGIVPEEGMMRISELRERFFETHSRRILRMEDTFFAKAGLLLDDMADGARFGSAMVGRFFEVVDPDSDVQIAAVTFMPGDGTTFIAFRGTDSTLAGWKEDFNLSYLRETEGQRRAVQYLTEAAELTDGPIIVGGHSKGGNFSVYAAAFCGREVQDRIVNVYTNDGPGFRKEVTQTEGYQRIKHKVISIVPDTSIIGQLLEHEFPDIIVKSSEKGFRQHDGFTWCVNRNRFVHTALSDIFTREWIGVEEESAKEPETGEGEDNKVH